MIDELDWVRSVRPRVEPASLDARQAARQALAQAIASETARSKRGTGWPPRRQPGVRSSRSRGWVGTAVGGIPALLAVLVVAAVAVVALTLGSHHHAPAPTPTTDALGSAPSVVAKLPLGTAAGPLTADANRFQGAAIPSSVKLVAETADPHGGLPWGLPEFQSTRRQTCLQVGRVQDGTIGVIGQDGAWADDHRFHPISPNAYTGQHCSQTDGNGHAFNNVSEDGAIASAVVPWGTGLQGDGCGGRVGGRPQPPCPQADRRSLNYGLLGPDATSITYMDADGRLFNEATNPPDGAYLIAGLATRPRCVLPSGGGRSCNSPS